MAAMSGQRGQTTAEYAGVLVVIAAIIFALATGDVHRTIGAGVSDIVCRIAGQGCADTAAAAAAGPRPRIQTLGHGPALGGGGDVAILPFPGSVSVTCGFGPGSEEKCKAPDGPNLRVKG